MIQPKRLIGFSVYFFADVSITFLFWRSIAHIQQKALLFLPAALIFSLFLLWTRHYVTRTFWLKVWIVALPWLFGFLLFVPALPVWSIPLLCFSWGMLSMWGYYRFYPLFLFSFHLHKARFARRDELRDLLHTNFPTDGLLLGRSRYLRNILAVRPHKKHREIGNLLIVAPTRLGKGLLAVSQLLCWKHSVIINDIKGDLFTQTAGYRSSIGDVYVIDPTRGEGHCFDPVAEKSTEKEFGQIADHLLFEGEERDPIFTKRAISMLTQLFLAAKQEQLPALPYVRSLVRLGLVGAATRLQSINPDLATQFLDVHFAKANFEDRFLNSTWSTLTAKLRPLLTDTLVRSFTHSDFTPREMMQSDRAVTVYFRWQEQDLHYLSPLIRLLWGSLIHELTTTYDTVEGKNCHPVLMLIDEAGRTAIPGLADQATTVVGRGVYLWVAVQSLSQLEEKYGKIKAQVIRDNMEHQLYYRSYDLSTAEYLQKRCGEKSGFAKSTTARGGEVTSEGEAERPVHLITAQEIMQFKDTDVLGFHRQLPPFKLKRFAWYEHTLLRKRRSMKAPLLPVLSPIPEMHTLPQEQYLYIDPDYAYLPSGMNRREGVNEIL